MKKKKFNKKLILIVYKLIFIEFFMYEMCFSFYLIIYFYLALINNFIYDKKIIIHYFNYNFYI